jgi:hypothetical protein
VTVGRNIKLRFRLRIISRELSSAKITEKRWQRDSWQFAGDGAERVQLGVESHAVKRRLCMCCSAVIFGMCGSVRLVSFLC